MTKTILLTGATDGIGLETAKALAAMGHNLLLHARDKTKAEYVKTMLLSINSNAKIDLYLADLSELDQVKLMAKDILNSEQKLDAIINNAGVLVSNKGLSTNGMDIRFMVNTIAPYVLTKLLLPVLNTHARIVNLSSAAQMPLNWDAFENGGELEAHSAYAQSKLSLTMWSMELAQELGANYVVVAVNPKSLLGSKMVKEAYGQQGFNLEIGADILCRAALAEEFAASSGKYFDNDVERFTNPHPFALIKENRAKLMGILDNYL